jgi:hypothetical protein
MAQAVRPYQYPSVPLGEASLVNRRQARIHIIAGNNEAERRLLGALDSKPQQRVLNQLRCFAAESYYAAGSSWKPRGDVVLVYPAETQIGGFSAG